MKRILLAAAVISLATAASGFELADQLCRPSKQVSAMLIADVFILRQRGEVHVSEVCQRPRGDKPSVRIAFCKLRFENEEGGADKAIVALTMDESGLMDGAALVRYATKDGPSKLDVDWADVDNTCKNLDNAL